MILGEFLQHNLYIYNLWYMNMVANLLFPNREKNN